MAKKKRHYVKNKDLLAEILKSREQGRITSEASEMFYLIAEGLSKRLVYQDDEDRKDCISYAVEECLKYWDRFDPDRQKYPNPFAYFTQVCKNGFAKSWRELGKYHFPNSIMVRLDNENMYSL